MQGHVAMKQLMLLPGLPPSNSTWRFKTLILGLPSRQSLLAKRQRGCHHTRENTLREMYSLRSCRAVRRDGLVGHTPVTHGSFRSSNPPNTCASQWQIHFSTVLGRLPAWPAPLKTRHTETKCWPWRFIICTSLWHLLHLIHLFRYEYPQYAKVKQ
jgi:hypothetical protein